MANTLQARKRIRRNSRRTTINKHRISRIRSFIKAVEKAVASGDKKAAETALVAAQPEMMRGVSRGAFHAKTMSRKFSRLTQAVRKMA